MNQANLVEAVAEASGLTKGDATRVVHELFQKITGALSQGDEVRVPGFGTFAVAERAAREGRNPRTGEVVQIAASKAPKFKPAKQLRDAVNITSS
ncbi:MAG: HU family DNA-binding protein [Rhodospirillaceae bacterium]